MSRLPTLYLPHGGGPWPFVELGMDKAEVARLAAYLRSVADVPKERPTALLVISAHWEERVPTVMSGTAPPMLYDYYGFPPAAYTITWPAPGRPELAARVRTLLHDAGFGTAENTSRGYDHGTFIPMKLAYPDAGVPTVQLSLKKGLQPGEHLAIGRALAPLREEGVFIIGSGMSYHNLQAFWDPSAGPVSEAFDVWLQEATTQAHAERDRRLTDWAHAPGARISHPREEHLLPLMVVAGAGGADPGSVPFTGTMMGKRISAIQYG